MILTYYFTYVFSVDYNWLVVWNTTFIFPNSWDDDPIWRTHIFQRDRPTTNQYYHHITILFLVVIPIYYLVGGDWNHGILNDFPIILGHTIATSNSQQWRHSWRLSNVWRNPWEKWAPFCRWVYEGISGGSTKIVRRIGQLLWCEKK